MLETVTAFLDGRIVATGSRDEVTAVIEDRYGAADHAAIQVFADETGKILDLDLWDAAASSPHTQRSRGRPKLGVQAREVTLLPRHWDWLSVQPGGASAALRRLVDDARREGGGERERRDAAYHFMQASCGDRPGYEEALRALYRGERHRFHELVSAWPADVRRYLGRLLGG